MRLLPSALQLYSPISHGSRFLVGVSSDRARDGLSSNNLSVDDFRAAHPAGGARAVLSSPGASRVARTLRTSESGAKGFAKNATSAWSTPRRSMEFSV